MSDNANSNVHTYAHTTEVVSHKDKHHGCPYSFTHCDTYSDAI